ncbi:hypothetical protein JQ633_33480 [Bradyrhizobium tropiciagri]|uniref:hypothetical protein n=1 Tax=Bradyrhizobium tropiciagri TaxID=312253 RepID=UPI001BA6752E|nr:hypothetical protein [Bradyrhizobium tropiciagri]MBR0875312.1 hypothetical protein [Bradyrhizobium tropiciagri]
MKDAFDQRQEWANKSLDDDHTINVAIWRPIVRLPEVDRQDREKVNAAVAKHKEESGQIVRAS